ncbi:MAG: redoxin domain-containing protein, partial [Vicinamibacterales bacterium]
MHVDVGTPAPDFTLVNQDREPVTLSGSRGRCVVLALFPAAYSATCSQELCTIRDHLATLGTARAQVYGISVDSFFALKAFQRDQNLPFP